MAQAVPESTPTAEPVKEPTAEPNLELVLTVSPAQDPPESVLKQLLLLGDPRLQTSSQAVRDVGKPAAREASALLLQVLSEFRRVHRFGRAVSAPQIGHPLRMIAIDLGRKRSIGIQGEARSAFARADEAGGKTNTHIHSSSSGAALVAPFVPVAVERHHSLRELPQPFVMVDPVITYRSHDSFVVWDDCMSIPGLMFKVSRSKSISVMFTMMDGTKHNCEYLPYDESELLQHEIDHLDGILVIDKMAGHERGRVISRDYYLQNKAKLDEDVGYSIKPSI